MGISDNMTWTMLTPLVPYTRVVLFAIAAILFLDVMIRTYRDSAETKEPPELAVRKHRPKLAAMALCILTGLAITGSSAWRPKDRIAADYGDQDAYLEQVDAAEDKASPEVLKGTGPERTDWESARKKFRDQVGEEEENFEKATTKD